MNMSSWQSFFNQLTKPPKSGTSASSEIICKCNKGNLVAVNITELKTSGTCTLDSFCSIIQIDRFRALTINSGEISIFTKDVYTAENSLKQKSNPLDGIL